jgi:uncharacterized protein YqhQ
MGRRSSVLSCADAAATLPRLGGMARPDGVVIVSERFWAFAGVDGSLREGAMPRPRPVVRRIPLVRGLFRLAASVSPLFRRSGVARRGERRFLGVIVLAPLVLYPLHGTLAVGLEVVLTLGIGAWLLRGRTLALHGAEHRAIAAAEERRLDATWAGDVRPSRFSARCGTNFAALVLPVTVAFDHVWVLPTAAFTPLVVMVLSLALSMELWQLVQRCGDSVARVVLAPGLAMQRVTTREPELEETRVALRAVASVLEREFEL